MKGAIIKRGSWKEEGDLRYKVMLGEKVLDVILAVGEVAAMRIHREGCMRGAYPVDSYLVDDW